MPTLLNVEEGSIVATSTLQDNQGFVTEKLIVKQRYLVLSDTLSDNYETIQETSGIPQLWEEVNTGIVNSVEAKEMHTVRHPETGVLASIWSVDVGSDSRISDPSGNSGGGGGEVETYQPSIAWTSETVEQIVYKDVETDDPIQTKAGEPIKATTRRTVPILEIKRLEPFPFDPNIILTYSNKVISGSFWGAPEKTAFMDSISTEMASFAGITYDAVTYRIKFDFGDDGEGDGWKFRPLHQGTIHNILETGDQPPSEAPKKKLTDEAGNPRVANLDSLGSAKGDKYFREEEVPYYLEFSTLKSVDASPLNIEFSDVTP